MLSSILFCLLCCSQILSQNVSFYPSDINLRPFVQTLKSVVDRLEDVMRDGMKRLELVTEYLDYYTDEYAKLLRERQTYLEHPINRFTFIYGLTKGLVFVQEVMKERRVFKIDTSLHYPNLADMELQVFILSRLQRFYQLNVTQLAAGILNTSYSESGQVYVEYFSKLTSSDCYTIGKIMCKYKQITQGVLWLAEALNLYDRDNAFSDFDKRHIYLCLANAFKMLDNGKHFLKLMKERLNSKMDYIDDRRIAQDIIAYQSKLNNEEESQSKQTKLKLQQEVRDCIGVVETSNYRRHCRGEVRVHPAITKRLKCWYFTGYHPFLRLAPIRTEQLYIQPDIFQHYDVISNREIKNITSFEAQLNGCQLNGANNCNNTVLRCLSQINIRKCMSTTINSSADSINQRIYDLTGLSSKDVKLEVTYYSYGSHFNTHLDSWRRRTFLECVSKTKARVANFAIKETPTGIIGTQDQMLVIYNMCLYREQTVLFYLSNVKQGGATVFPLLGVTVFPKKGSVISWTNMNPTSNNDVTCHSACPVLRGNKWVATKWINFDGQELKRPCVDQFPNRHPMDTPPPVLKEEYLKIFK